MIRKIICFVLVGMFFASFCYAKGHVKHTFSDLKFAIKCPGEWEVHKMPGEFESVVGIILPSDSINKGFRANMMVTSKANTKPPITLERFYNLNLDNNSKSPNLPNFKLIESAKIKIGNLDAYKVVFTSTHPRLKILLKSLQIYIVDPKNVYVINYMAQNDIYERHIDTVEEIINSFKPLE